jgi:protein gp37
MSTKIEWCANQDGSKGKTWNPITGCTKISPGCQNCYAERMAARLAGVAGYPTDNPFAITWHEDKLDLPTRWKMPQRIFPCSMSDIFHEDIPQYWQERVFEVMRRCSRHTFMVLTKRPQNILDPWKPGKEVVSAWPDNIWLGITAENQEWLAKRLSSRNIPKVSILWLSLEPLLGPVDLSPWSPWLDNVSSKNRISWVVIGCESGPRRRPCKLVWVKSIIDQCVAANVPVFVKQMDIGGRVSHDPAEWPEWARIREYPVPNTAGCGF